MPLVGVPVTILPAVSVPIDSDTVAVPSPDPTVCAYSYSVVDTLVIDVAASV